MRAVHSEADGGGTTAPHETLHDSRLGLNFLVFLRARFSSEKGHVKAPTYTLQVKKLKNKLRFDAIHKENIIRSLDSEFVFRRETWEEVS
eukprot:scaffold39049_cov155-Skeletonema_dohrnii-CCMP3373.AAC.2